MATPIKTEDDADESPMPEVDESSKPKVILFRLEPLQEDDDDYFFNHVHQRLMAFLDSQAQVKTAWNAGQALEALNNDRPQAILIVDATLSITDPTHGEFVPARDIILDKLREYLNRGGTAIFCSSFTTANFDDMTMFWHQQFNLPWAFCAYHREHVQLQAAANQNFPRNNYLKLRYNHKAVFLRNVGRSMALYKPSSTSELTSVAWADYGEGHIGFIGDVNHEEISDEVAFAMCGFSDLDPALESYMPDTSMGLRFNAETGNFEWIR